MIQDASHLFGINTVYSMAGFLLVHFVVQQSPLLATFEIDFLFLGGVGICGYMYDPITHQVCHTIKSLLQ